MQLSYLTSVILYWMTGILGSAGLDVRDDEDKSFQPIFTFDELYRMQVNFLDNYLYPANLVQAQAINSTLFSENVQGRVDLTRTFDGRELNTEYMFGLFSDPGPTNLFGTPINYSITQFSASGNIASCTSVFTYNMTVFGALVPVTIDTWKVFNEKKEIEQYDVVYRWFPWLLDTLVANLGTMLNTTTVGTYGFLTQYMANNICNVHELYCTGDNQQYADATACYNFLTEQIRFGASYELGRNTLFCRQLHSQMLKYRPSVHCPHIGPSGGGMCVDDQTYAQKVLQKYYTNAPWIPFGYDKKKPDIWE